MELFSSGGASLFKGAFGTRLLRVSGEGPLCVHPGGFRNGGRYGARLICRCGGRRRGYVSWGLVRMFRNRRSVGLLFGWGCHYLYVAPR